MFSGPTVNAELLGPRGKPHRVRGTEGMPLAIRNYMISLPYNDIELLEQAFHTHGEELAAVMVEPVMGNVAGIVARLDWLQRLRQLCSDYGVVLIFDEVKTGFRVARGGAQEVFGVRADLAAYAKAMGNGFPVSAVAGRADIMRVVEPGRVAHGGTYCGNVVAAAAANATLEILETQPILETIAARGRELMAGIDAILTRADIPHVLAGVPAMFSVLLGKDQAPVDYRAYATFDAEMFGKLGAALIARGVLVDDDPREPWFLCFAHDWAVIGETLEIFEAAVNDAFGNARRIVALAA
jgi:glutamate-1-semialdehyde 2,1-aminomutase